MSRFRGDRRRRRVWLSTTLAALLALALGTAWVVDQRTRATPLSLDDALAELHREAGPQERDGTQAPPSAASPAIPQAPPTSDGGTGTPPATADGGRPAPGAADAHRDAFAPPPTGVYTYRTTGGDRVSMLGARHDYPQQTYATVTGPAGCRWRLEQRVIKEHVDTYDWCSSPEGLQLLTLRHDIEFFEQQDSIEYRCPPDGRFVAAGDEPGATHHTVCRTAADNVLEMTVKVTGRGTRTVDGVTVPTISYRADFTMTGKATGRARWDGVIHAASGLRLYEHRVVSTRARAVFGEVHYEEDVAFDLVSLTPHR